MTNSSEPEQQEQQQEQQMLRLSLGPPCYHQYDMSLSQTRREIEKGNKAGRRDPIDRTANILCPKCINRDDRVSCSIDPFRKVLAMTTLMPPRPKKIITTPTAKEEEEERQHI
jgi:hypothetical protein